MPTAEAMDVPRARAKPRLRRVVLVGGALAVLVGATFAIRRVATRPPSVAKSSLWIGDVVRGPLQLEVRGTGTLVPLDFRWASAPVAARVDRVLVQPGAVVTADTVIVELANPEAELEMLNADRDVSAAQAELAKVGAQLDGSRLAQESAVAGLGADVAIAKRRGAIDSDMADKGVISDLERAESVDRAGQLASRLEFEKKRLGALDRGNAAQVEAQRTQIERLKELAAFRRRQLDALHVRAGQDGVVQQIAVEAGQSVAVGAQIAKVIAPERLKARLKIPEASVGDVALGMPAKIDTRDGVIAGEVERIDPAASAGNVTVDVKLTAALPKSARADQNVDGVIDLATTGDVLHVQRPAIGDAHAEVVLWKLDPDGARARRVTVRFGRAAVKDIEIARGLAAGDRIVLGDMAKYDGHDEIRIED